LLGELHMGPSIPWQVSLAYPMRHACWFLIEISFKRKVASIPQPSLQLSRWRKVTLFPKHPRLVAFPKPSNVIVDIDSEISAPNFNILISRSFSMLGRENVFLGIKQFPKSSFGTGRAHLGPQQNTFRHQLTRPSCYTGRAPFGPQRKHLLCINYQGHLPVLGELPSGPKYVYL
jgi:hypothetical protein